MGDSSDMSDIERFMRSPEGTAVLETIRQSALGQRIVEVDFQNGTSMVNLVLCLEDGTTFHCGRYDLEVENLREEYAAVLEREYSIDFPGRKNR